MPAVILDGQTDILVIRINHSNAGLFAYLSFVLNQISYCEKHGLIPVVNFGPWSVDGPNAYCDPSIGDNMWDYYFEPVAGYSYRDIQGFIDDPQHPLTKDNLVHLADDELAYLHAGDPDSIYNYPYGYYTELAEKAEDWYARQRLKAQGLIQKYIRVKQDLIDEVDAFVRHHFGQQPILGLHIRGTDKGCASAAQHIAKIIPPEKYFAHIDEYIEQHPECKIFLATDQVQYVEQVRMRYLGRVLTQSTILSDSQVNAFQKNDGKNYQKGKEVLLDCLLLSRCSKLLKCSSAVGEYAHYFNPELQSLDLNERYGRPSTYQLYYRQLLVEPYIFLRELVGKLKDPQVSKAEVCWYVLTDYPWVRSFFNRLEEALFSGNSLMRSLFLVKKYISFKRHKVQIPFLQVRQLAALARKRPGANYYSFIHARGKKYLEIRTDADPHAAFFAQFLYVLQQLRFAEIHQLIPVVNLDQPYNYYFDSHHGANVWENYFEPVAQLSSSDLDKVDAKTIAFLDHQSVWELHLGDGDIPPIHYDDDTRLWWQRQRDMGARLTADYVRVKPQVQALVEEYYRTFMQEHKVLGMHLRGTDKSVAFDGTPHAQPEPFTRIIPPEEYFPFIDKYLGQNPEGKLFVATDQLQFLQTLQDRYGECVLSTRAKRSATEKAVFSRTGAGYELGVEVLTDVLLLSRCDFLIKCMSNVGEVATYFNPELPVIDICYPHNIDDFEHFFS